jgi:hypothetical protein
MRRLVPALAIPILAGLPLWVEMSWLVGFFALAGGAVCLIALLRASLALAAGGGALALSSLALALRDSPSTNMFVMAIFGLALLLVADGAHCRKRLEGAAVTTSLWRRYIVWWIGRGSISLAITIVIVALAPLVAISLPQLWGPLLSGVGILVAFAAAVAFAWPNMDD